MNRATKALSEEYRAVCPSCGSHHLRVNQGGSIQSHGRSADIGDTNIYCRECQTHHTEVYDKKKGHMVSL